MTHPSITVTVISYCRVPYQSGPRSTLWGWQRRYYYHPNLNNKENKAYRGVVSSQNHTGSQRRIQSLFLIWFWLWSCHRHVLICPHVSTPLAIKRIKQKLFNISCCPWTNGLGVVPHYGFVVVGFLQWVENGDKLSRIIIFQVRDQLLSREFFPQMEKIC